MRRYCIDNRAQILFRTAQRALGLLALGDVRMGFQNRDRAPRLVAAECPAGGDLHLTAIAPHGDEFAFPMSEGLQGGVDLGAWNWEAGADPIVCQLAGHVCPRPTVQRLGSGIPECHFAVPVTDEHRILRQIQQTGLVARRLGGRPVSRREDGGDADCRDDHDPSAD
jgi:hypothetical protein